MWDSLPSLPDERWYLSVLLVCGTVMVAISLLLLVAISMVCPTVINRVPWVPLALSLVGDAKRVGAHRLLRSFPICKL